MLDLTLIQREVIMKLVFLFIFLVCSVTYAEQFGKRCGYLTIEPTIFHYSPPPQVFVITTAQGCRYETAPRKKIDTRIRSILENKILSAKKQPAFVCVTGWMAGGPACQGWAAYFSDITSVR